MRVNNHRSSGGASGAHQISRARLRNANDGFQLKLARCVPTKLDWSAARLRTAGGLARQAGRNKRQLAALNTGVRKP
jgi:hypothetical protein